MKFSVLLRTLFACAVGFAGLFAVSTVSAGGGKVVICHVTPDGQMTKEIPLSATDGGHFASEADYWASGPDNRIGRHGGDYRGECVTASPTPEPTTPVTPVPTEPPATIVVTEPPVTATIEATEPPPPTVTVEVTQPPATIPATIEVTVTAGV